MPSPIKRHPALQPLSRDHHFGLLLCWKIRKGLSIQIEPKRIKAYTEWFWNAHLKHHFEVEEKSIFPILGDKNEGVQRAIQEHWALTELFESSSELRSELEKLEVLLNAHIRFEERELFNAIQEKATPEQVLEIQKLHHTEIDENAWDDRFWE